MKEAHVEKKKRKKILSILFRIILSAGLLIYLFNQIDFQKTKDILVTARIDFIVVAFLITSLIYGVLLFRWLAFIRAMGLHVSFLTVSRFHFLGVFFNSFLPTGVGGDLVKVIGLCAHTKKKPKVVASAVVDRLVGFLGMVAVATVAFVLGYRLINDLTLMSSVVVLMFLSGGITLGLFHERIYSFGCQVFKPFPKFREKLMEMHYAIAALKDRRGVIYLTMAYSALAQVTLVVAYFFLAKALHQDVIFMYFLVFTPLICVTTSVPSIGGLGVREAATVFLFAKAGIAPGVAVSISLMVYLFTICVGILGMVFYGLTRPSPEKSLGEVKKGLQSELLE